MDHQFKTPLDLPGNGFGLVEILVALGLVSIISLGISSIITSTAKQQKGIQVKGQQREVTSEIRSLLAEKIACTNSFAGETPSTAGFTVDSIKDTNSIVRYQKNTPDSTDYWYLKNLKYLDLPL